LLLKTESTPIATVMKRLLTGYAMHYNRRHKRSGHLFQNRYKSILCQEDAYLLELVRYIHLNHIRAKLVEDMRALDKYRYGGHSALMGKTTVAFQNENYILGLFGDKVSPARRKYRAFVEKGIADGKRPELTGGGLIRSVGGWAAAKALRRANALQKGDERILGDGDFVDAVLSEAKEAYERKYRLKAKGIDIDAVANRAAQIIGVEPSQVWTTGKQPKVVQARSLLCYWATSELGVPQEWLSKQLKLSQPAISLSVARGRAIALKYNYEIGNL
jgi:hypothetical protein